MALTKEQIREGTIVRADGGNAQLIGFWSKQDYENFQKGSLNVTLIGQINKDTGHSGNGVSMVDFNGNTLVYSNMTCWNINPQTADFISNPTSTTTSSSLPEQQFITGMKFKVSDSSTHLKECRGEMVLIEEYKAYHGTTEGYMVKTPHGCCYECDFEAFEPPVSSQYLSGDGVYKTIPSRPSEPTQYATYDEIYKGTDNTKPITPSLISAKVVMMDISEPDLKVKLNGAVFMNTKLPTLNTNF